MTESDNIATELNLGHLMTLPDGSLTQEEVSVIVGEVDRLKRVVIDQQNRLIKQGKGVQTTQRALTRRNGLIKVLIANLAQPGESCADILHRCGLAMSSEGYKTAMEVGKSDV